MAKLASDRIIVLRDIGDYRTAIAACETYARFVDVDHPNGRESIVGVHLHKGLILRDLGRMHEAVQVCDEIIADSATDTDQALRPIVALALRNKANILQELAWPEAAADVYAELVARFANDDQPQILEQVTLARKWLVVLRTRER